MTGTMPVTGTMLVTGATGFLGERVCRLADQAGWRVVAVGHRRSVGGGPTLDVLDAVAVQRAFETAAPAVVVHTAASQDGGPDELTAVNVDGTANVATACRAIGARLLHVSTDVVFAGDRTAPYREADELGAVTAYGRSKQAAEVAVREVDGLAVRVSLLLGAHRIGRHERLVLDAAAGATDLTFFTDEIRCPLHVDDAAAALVELAGRPDVRGVANALHLGGPVAVSRAELAALVARYHYVDPARLSMGPTPAGMVRPRHVVLDSSLAASVLTTRIRSVRDLLRPAGWRFS